MRFILLCLFSFLLYSCENNQAKLIDVSKLDEYNVELLTDHNLKFNEEKILISKGNFKFLIEARFTGCTEETKYSNHFSVDPTLEPYTWAISEDRKSYKISFNGNIENLEESDSSEFNKVYRLISFNELADENPDQLCSQLKK